MNDLKFNQERLIKEIDRTIKGSINELITELENLKPENPSKEWDFIRELISKEIKKLESVKNEKTI